MNKEELVQEIAKKAKVTQKDASEVLGALVDTIQKTVAKGKKVTLVGFGTFEPRKRAARNGRNPQTGAEIKIAAKTVPAFSAGKKFKTVVNGYHHFNIDVFRSICRNYQSCWKLTRDHTRTFWNW